MSRTDLSVKALAEYLRRKAGDGSLDWYYGPMQASVMLDIADMLDESAPRLPHWWTADGTLHIEAPKLPESIAVTLPDERDREVHSARAWRYVREDESEMSVTSETYARFRDEPNALYALLEMKQDYDTENAKLRELVSDMYEMAYPEYPSAFKEAFADRMRELGIEVD